MQTIDRAALLNRVEGDAMLLAQLVEIFEEDGGRLVASLEAAVRAGDARGVERAAHTLKGMVLNFTASTAASAAGRLEELGRNGRLEESAQALGALEKELAALRPQLLELCAEVAS